MGTGMGMVGAGEAAGGCGMWRVLGYIPQSTPISELSLGQTGMALLSWQLQDPNHSLG